MIALSIITYGLLLPNPNKRKDISDGSLIKPYRPVAFYSGFLCDAALYGITVDCDVAPPSMVYILHTDGGY